MPSASTVSSFELFIRFGCRWLGLSSGIYDEGTKARRYQADGYERDPDEQDRQC